jgi:hypothetical protein
MDMGFRIRIWHGAAVLAATLVAGVAVAQDTTADHEDGGKWAGS